MTAVLPAVEQVPAPAQTTYAPWGLSVRDWQVHALVEPPDSFADWHSVQTACDSRHPIGCPVKVARRGEVCQRCAAHGVQRLEILPNRRDDGSAAR